MHGAQSFEVNPGILESEPEGKLWKRVLHEAVLDIEHGVQFFALEFEAVQTRYKRHWKGLKKAERLGFSTKFQRTKLQVARGRLREIERRLDSAEEFFFDAHSNFPFVCSVFGYDARSARARVRKMLDPIGQDRLKLRRFNDSHKEVLVVVAAS